MTDLIGTLWREKETRFERIVEVVAVGQRIGRRTVSYNGTPGHPTRVTFGETTKFFKRFERLPEAKS